MSGKQRKTRLYQWVGVGLLLSASFLAGAAHADDWPFGGEDIHNTRASDNENKISVKNVAGLKPKWELTTHGDVSATPTVQGNNVYAVDWGGYLYSIDNNTGNVNWSHQLTEYTGNTVSSASRTSPTIVDDHVIIGDQGDVASSGFPQGGGTTASVMAINKNNGKLAWRTVVSDHPFSCITSSPVAYNGVLYVGVSSLEENAGFIPGYSFSYRGRVVALDAHSGAILWTFVTIKDSAYKKGFTGASVWGSTPVVDENRCSLYIGTGNNYSAPAGYTSPGGLKSPEDDHFDSILALDLATGRLKWHFRAWNGDKWDVATWVESGSPSYTYPNNTDIGPDWDFGSGPNLFTTWRGDDCVGAGAKSGIYYALNPDDGSLRWQTQVGPGGTGGGIEWGSAVDGNRVYSAISNSDGHVIPQFSTTSHPYTGGLWAGLDACTGAILWQTADPLGGHDYGMVTYANGVVYAASAGQAVSAANPNGAPGGFFAMDAGNGKILWQFTSANDPSMGSSICGPSVVNGTVYWGSGYSHLVNAFGISGTPKLYAFSLP